MASNLPDEFVSFADPDTHFHIPRMGTTYPPGKVYNGRPSGMVVCLQCGHGDENVDEIDHAPTCPQRFVHSRWWVEQHDDAGQEA